MTRKKIMTNGDGTMRSLCRWDKWEKKYQTMRNNLRRCEFWNEMNENCVVLFMASFYGCEWIQLLFPASRNCLYAITISIKRNRGDYCYVLSEISLFVTLKNYLTKFTWFCWENSQNDLKHVRWFTYLLLNLKNKHKSI